MYAFECRKACSEQNANKGNFVLYVYSGNKIGTPQTLRLVRETLLGLSFGKIVAKYMHIFFKLLLELIIKLIKLRSHFH